MTVDSTAPVFVSSTSRDRFTVLDLYLLDFFNNVSEEAVAKTKCDSSD